MRTYHKYTIYFQEKEYLLGELYYFMSYGIQLESGYYHMRDYGIRHDLNVGYFEAGLLLHCFNICITHEV